MDITPKGVSRVLIYRLGSLGDTVVALPALHLIARSFPGAERRLLTNWPVNAKSPPAQDILGESALVQGYFNYPLRLRDPFRIGGLVRSVKRWRPDLLVYLAEIRSPIAVFRDYVFFRLCGIRRIIGAPTTPRLWNSQRLPEGIFESEAARLARCLRPLGDARLNDRASWDLHLDGSELANADQALEQWSGRAAFVAASVGAKVQVKDWGKENWRLTLAALSSRYPTLGLVLVGSGDEFEIAEFASSGWHGPRLNLCGKLKPRESAAATRHALAYIGHDSGPMHLAAAMGVRCVSVFAARHLPGVWFPHGPGHQIIYHRIPCSGCGLEVCVKKKKTCIASITPAEVLSAAGQTLRAHPE